MLRFNNGKRKEQLQKCLTSLTDSEFGWDRVVLRLPPRRPPVPPCPVVPVRLSLPGGLFPPSAGPAVYQAGPGALRPPGTGIRLPIPARRTVEALLAGSLPVPGDRWIRAWKRVWEAPWGR